MTQQMNITKVFYGMHVNLCVFFVLFVLLFFFFGGGEREKQPEKHFYKFSKTVIIEWDRFLACEFAGITHFS